MFTSHGARRATRPALLRHRFSPQSAFVHGLFALFVLSAAHRTVAQEAPEQEVTEQEVNAGSLKLLTPEQTATEREDSAYWAEPPQETTPSPCEAGDMDRDGLCDELEQATGTKALRADTDDDGVPDGVEDADRDGVLDPGESDPRVPGLFPGGYPHIPEPMVFDLVRGLGAKAGEVEVNTLAVYSLRRRDRHLSWAPEVEWAFADGIAVELELPMRDRELEALKAAFQVTLPSSVADVTHGLQLIGEYLLDARETQAAALYIVGARVRRWSMLTLAGVRATTPMDGRALYEAIVNPSLYRDLTERLTVGLEGNLAVSLSGRARAAVVPQLHWQITKQVRVQAGPGLGIEGRHAYPVFASRVILE